jgi:hypothetical protein
MALGNTPGAHGKSSLSWILVDVHVHYFVSKVGVLTENTLVVVDVVQGRDVSRETFDISLKGNRKAVRSLYLQL